MLLTVQQYDTNTFRCNCLACCCDHYTADVGSVCHPQATSRDGGTPDTFVTLCHPQSCKRLAVLRQGICIAAVGSASPVIVSSGLNAANRILQCLQVRLYAFQPAQRPARATPAARHSRRAQRHAADVPINQHSTQQCSVLQQAWGPAELAMPRCHCTDVC
jgi:hypothetical protein